MFGSVGSASRPQIVLPIWIQPDGNELRVPLGSETRAGDVVGFCVETFSLVGNYFLVGNFDGYEKDFQSEERLYHLVRKQVINSDAGVRFYLRRRKKRSSMAASKSVEFSNIQYCSLPQEQFGTFNRHSSCILPSDGAPLNNIPHSTPPASDPASRQPRRPSSTTFPINWAPAYNNLLNSRSLPRSPKKHLHHEHSSGNSKSPTTTNERAVDIGVLLDCVAGTSGQEHAGSMKHEASPPSTSTAHPQPQPSGNSSDLYSLDHVHLASDNCFALTDGIDPTDLSSKVIGGDMASSDMDAVCHGAEVGRVAVAGGRSTPLPKRFISRVTAVVGGRRTPELVASPLAPSRLPGSHGCDLESQHETGGPSISSTQSIITDYESDSIVLASTARPHLSSPAMLHHQIQPHPAPSLFSPGPSSGHPVYSAASASPSPYVSISLPSGYSITAPHSQGMPGVQHHQQHAPHAFNGGSANTNYAELVAIAARQKSQIQRNHGAIAEREAISRLNFQNDQKSVAHSALSERLRTLCDYVAKDSKSLEHFRQMKLDAEARQKAAGKHAADLETLRRAFAAKERELSRAVGKVDELKRELDELRQRNATSQSSNPIWLELERLKKDINLRRQLNADRRTDIDRKQITLRSWEADSSRSDARIEDLVRRLGQQQLHSAPTPPRLVSDTPEMPEPLSGSVVANGQNKGLSSRGWGQPFPQRSGGLIGVNPSSTTHSDRPRAAVEPVQIHEKPPRPPSPKLISGNGFGVGDSTKLDTKLSGINRSGAAVSEGVLPLGVSFSQKFDATSIATPTITANSSTNSYINSKGYVTALQTVTEVLNGASEKSTPVPAIGIPRLGGAAIDGIDRRNFTNSGKSGKYTVNDSSAINHNSSRDKTENPVTNNNSSGGSDNGTTKKANVLAPKPFAKQKLSHSPSTRMTDHLDSINGNVPAVSSSDDSDSVSSLSSNRSASNSQFPTPITSASGSVPPGHLLPTTGFLHNHHVISICNSSPRSSVNEVASHEDSIHSGSPLTITSSVDSEDTIDAAELAHRDKPREHVSDLATVNSGADATKFSSSRLNSYSSDRNSPVHLQMENFNQLNNNNNLTINDVGTVSTEMGHAEYILERNRGCTDSSDPSVESQSRGNELEYPVSTAGPNKASPSSGDSSFPPNRPPRNPSTSGTRGIKMSINRRIKMPDEALLYEEASQPPPDLIPPEDRSRIGSLASRSIQSGNGSRGIFHSPSLSDPSASVGADNNDSFGANDSANDSSLRSPAVESFYSQIETDKLHIRSDNLRAVKRRSWAEHASNSETEHIRWLLHREQQKGRPNINLSWIMDRSGTANGSDSDGFQDRLHFNGEEANSNHSLGQGGDSRFSRSTDSAVSGEAGSQEPEMMELNSSDLSPTNSSDESSGGGNGDYGRAPQDSRARNLMITRFDVDDSPIPGKILPLPIVPPPVKGILKAVPADFDGKDRVGRRIQFDPLAILLDAALEGELELVKKSAQKLTSVSHSNDEGITALHNAICAGHYEIVRFLVEADADVNAQDSDGWTPLHCAASCNNMPMVKFLVEHGACVFATTVSDHETPVDKCEEEEDSFDICSQFLIKIQEQMGIMNQGRVYASYDYEATEPDEQSFREGDELAVVKREENGERGWWWAENSRTGQAGFIPRNYVALCRRLGTKRLLAKAGRQNGADVGDENNNNNNNSRSNIDINNDKMVIEDIGDSGTQFGAPLSDHSNSNGYHIESTPGEGMPGGGDQRSSVVVEVA